MNNELAEECKKEWAHLLYTQHDVSIKDTALKVGVSEACMRNWVGTGNWDSVKRSLRASKDTQLRHLYDLLDALYEKIRNAQEPTAKDLELYLKYTGTIKSLEGEVTTSIIVQVGGLFLTWLRRKDLELTKVVGKHYDKFIAHRTSPLNQ